MSTADFLFQNEAPSAWTNASYSDTSSPDWWQAAAQGLIARASQIAGEPYQAYSGPRVAELDPLSTGAAAGSTAYTGGVNSGFDLAKDLTQQAGTLFNQNDYNTFLSPYTEGVVDRIAQLGERNLVENLLPNVNDTFIRAGQFGSSGNADFTLRALRDTNESILGQQATALENAQNNAMKNYSDALTRQGTAGAQLGNLSTAQGAEARNQLNAQNQFGLQQQAQDQKNLNLAVEDFENQVNYPLQQLNTLNAIIRGYQPANNTVNYSTVPTYGSTSPLTNAANVLTSTSGS